MWSKLSTMDMSMDQGRKGLPRNLREFGTNNLMIDEYNTVTGTIVRRYQRRYLLYTVRIQQGAQQPLCLLYIAQIIVQMFLALFVKIAVAGDPSSYPSTPPFFKRSRNDAMFSAPAAIFSVRASGEFLKRERARKQAPLFLKIQQIQESGYLRRVAAPLCCSLLHR